MLARLLSVIRSRVRTSRTTMIFSVITVVLIALTTTVIWKIERANKALETTTAAAPKTSDSNTGQNPTATTTSPSPTTTPTPAPTPTPSPTPAPKPTPTPTPAPSPAPAPPASCTNPVFSTSSTNGGWSNGGFYVHNNMWNVNNYPSTTETLYACAYNNWYVVANATNPNNDGAVKTYPNVHKDLSGRTISSFTTLTSSFAGTSPSVGIYDVAYDLWLNGVPNDEVMIWTDNYRQVPGGNRFASNVSLGGYTWDVYATGDNGYIAFVPSNGVRLTSGTIDIRALLNYLVSQGRQSAGSTVDQIGYGVELVSTNGTNQTFTFTNFSLNYN